MKSAVVILIFVLITVASHDPINGTLSFKNNIEFDNSHIINIRPPGNCKFGNLHLIRYTKLKLQVEIKNNQSNTLVVVLPSVNWNKRCINTCDDDIILHGIYSMLFHFIEFKSFGRSYITYDITINYICHDQEISDKSNAPTIIIILIILVTILFTTVVIYYNSKTTRNQYNILDVPAA